MVGKQAPAWYHHHLRPLVCHLLVYYYINTPKVVHIVTWLVDQGVAFVSGDWVLRVPTQCYPSKKCERYLWNKIL
jgi:hypothetical protein